MASRDAAPNLADEAPKPFQFGVRSLFLATSVVAVAFGVLKWLAPDAFGPFVIVGVQCLVVIAVLVKSKGTALWGVVIAGLIGAFLTLALNEFDVHVVFVLFYCEPRRMVFGRVCGK